MGAVAAIGGALVQASAAKKAAKAQTSAANKDIAFQKETRDLIRSDLGVYPREGGDLAQRALDFELGLGARPTFGDCRIAQPIRIPGTPQNVSVNGEADFRQDRHRVADYGVSG